MAKAMKKKPATKTVKAWATVGRGKVTALFLTHKAAWSWQTIGEIVVPGTFTYTPPAKPRKR